MTDFGKSTVFWDKSLSCTVGRVVLRQVMSPEVSSSIPRDGIRLEAAPSRLRSAIPSLSSVMTLWVIKTNKWIRWRNESGLVRDPPHQVKGRTLLINRAGRKVPERLRPVGSTIPPTTSDLLSPVTGVREQHVPRGGGVVTYNVAHKDAALNQGPAVLCTKGRDVVHDKTLR